jgi:hypothetical protein
MTKSSIPFKEFDRRNELRLEPAASLLHVFGGQPLAPSAPFPIQEDSETGI